MKEVVIVDAVRTPIGRGNLKNGIYRDTYADELGKTALTRLLKRNPFDVSLIDDIIFGCVKQEEEQGFNVARQILLLSGLPVELSAMTVNRLCGSGLEAVNHAALSIMAGYGDIFIAGGVEHMAHIPMGQGLNFNPKLFKHFSKDMISMGPTAELLSQKYSITREQQDEFSVRSHQNASRARDAGDFMDEIAPCYGRDSDGMRQLYSDDQGIRSDTSLDSLLNLKPAFLKTGGTITAGNSSQISDGASALLVMSRERCREQGFEPMARVRSMATAGVDPSLFGIGPVPAIQKALKLANLTLSDINAIELNEAFAVQALAVIKELNIDPEIVNMNGGAIALGHPLGCTGARISTTLLHLMRRKKLSLGISTMCIGLGQGIATIFEAL